MIKNTSFWLFVTQKTLAYSDIFNNPLTEKELWQRLITPIRIEKKKFSILLSRWQKEKKIDFKAGYYFLSGKTEGIKTRKKAEKLATKKILLAKKSAKAIAKIPFVWGVFLSGNLAVGVATKNDDIDLVVISAPNTLWLTRFAVYLYLKTIGRILGLRVRTPGSLETKDRLCLNLFLDYGDLEMNLESQNIFTAYQILFLKPLVSKNQTYQRLWSKNPWIADFIANGYQKIKLTKKEFKTGFFISTANKLFYFAQRLYMKGKPRGEKINLTQAFFHPDSKKDKALSLYEKKCKNFVAPLDI